jgi:CheY-like chemotaxis protein
LICDIPSQLGTAVMGDSLRLRQVIINLISNAVKFTERGEVRITVSHSGNGLFNSSFRFEIADSGIGIKPENTAAIFDSFAQEDSSTTRQYGGTGLGLAICKQLVELMNGEIGVTSSVGVGSTFFFSVPFETDAAAPHSRRLAALKSTKMLLVDDNAASLRILADKLTAWGATVATAASGQIALEITKNALPGEYDVLLLDCQMPGMSGAALAETLRTHAAFTETPIIMLQSGGAAGAAVPADRHVAVAWLTKPVRQDRLFDGIAGLRGGRQIRVAPMARPGSRPARRTPRRRVLLVEDNAVNQEVARAMLHEIGVETVSVWSGEEALDKLFVERFSLVLMDCQMPRLDGYATTRRFREWEQERKGQRTTIVALTANALSGDAEKCLAAGMDRYLSKPFTIEQLRNAMDGGSAGGDAPEVGPGLVGTVLDEAVLGRIRALHRPGHPDLLARVVNLYETNSLALIESLRGAMVAGSATALAKAAHALKSCSGNVGATTLATLCGDIEAAAGAGDLNEASLQVERLLSEHEQVLLALGAQTMAAA